MTKPLIYLCGPISGLSFDEARGTWRAWAEAELEKVGIGCLTPLPHGMLQSDSKHLQGNVSAQGDPSSVLGSTKGITSLDLFYVRQATLVLANFVGAKRVSIGSCIELGWANALGKTIVAAIPPASEQGDSHPHDHGMIDQVIDIRAPTIEEAVHTIKVMLRGMTDVPFNDFQVIRQELRK